MSKARITEEMSQRERKVRVAGSAVKSKPTTDTATKAGHRGSGLVCCTSSSILLTPDKTTAQRAPPVAVARQQFIGFRDRKSTRLNSSHVKNSYAVFCLKKKK